MTPDETLLIETLKARGVTSTAVFADRYGVPLDTLTVDAALAILRQSEHRRVGDRRAWTSIQRRNYVNGCILALERLKERLDRGLLILDSDDSLAVEVHWLRLATRAMRIIGRLARASSEAESAFLRTDVGRWYRALEWPTPSIAARREDW